MDKKERIKEAFNYLCIRQIVKTKTDVAEKMKTSKASTINALNGNENYLTESFIRKFCITFNGIFNIEWLLNGSGDMLLYDGNIAHNIIERSSIHNQTNGNNSPVIENNKIENDALVNRLLDELSATRKQNDTLIEILKEHIAR